jgi:hypothetical protein
MGNSFFKRQNICSGEIFFSIDDRPPLRQPCPIGGGGACDAPLLPEPEISPRLRTGTTAQSHPGNATAAEPRERHNYFK